MRKLRICPARAGSRLAGAPAAAPFFHCEASIEVSDERSALPLVCDAVSAAPPAPFAGHVARIPSPNSTLASWVEASITRPVTTSPSLCSAMYSSRLLGTSCFMLSRSWRFSLSMARTWALTTCPTFSTSRGWLIRFSALISLT